MRPPDRRSPTRARQTREPLVIGVVNNMPDAALETTERQFSDLLSAVSGPGTVRIRFFAIPEVPRGDVGRAYVTRHYGDLDTLRTSHIDGLIVTGTEPRTATLEDEPYWPALTRLIDWAEEHTTSTVWSCLAAHAAVYHMDGVRRVPLGEKMSGVFECERAGDDAMLSGLPSRWRIPHSRQNTLPEDALVDAGYSMLSTSGTAGVAMFARRRGSLFLFLQGHPEYDPGALLREYHRDVGRFLAAKRDTYPEMPRNYFGNAAAAALEDFRERALRNRDAELLGEFPAAPSGVDVSRAWRATAIRLYSNWLLELAHGRLEASAPTASPTRVAADPR